MVAPFEELGRDSGDSVKLGLQFWNGYLSTAAWTSWIKKAQEEREAEMEVNLMPVPASPQHCGYQRMAHILWDIWNTFPGGM